MLTTRSVIKTLKQLKFADLRQLAQENGLHVHSKMTKKEIIQALLWPRPRSLSLKLYGGARTESSSIEESPLVISKPVEWDKIPETALIEIIKRLPSKNDFNRFRRTSKKFNDRIKELETKDFYKELIANLPTNYVPIVLNADSGVFSVAWSPDGTRLVSGGGYGISGGYGIIQIWKFDPNTETFQQKPLEELRGHTSIVLSVTWSPDGTRLASGAYNKVIRIWNFDAKTKTFQQEPLELSAHTIEVSSVAWSPDGTRLASGGEDGIIRIWKFDPKTKTFQQNSSLNGHTSLVASVAWSPDGTRLASGGYDKIIRIWNTETFQQEPLELRSDTDMVLSVAWSPDGTRLASGGEYRIIRIWKFDPKTKTFQQEPSLDLDGHKNRVRNVNRVRSVAWSPDGTRLASAGEDKIIRIWNFDPNTETFQQKPLELRGHTGGVYSVVWSPDGTRLASGGVDDKILIWMS